MEGVREASVSKLPGYLRVGDRLRRSMYKTGEFAPKPKGVPQEQKAEAPVSPEARPSIDQKIQHFADTAIRIKPPRQGMFKRALAAVKSLRRAG